MKCPNCGSSSQLKLQTTNYKENGWGIEVTHYYTCSCGQASIGKSRFICQEGDELLEPYNKKELQEKLFGRG